MKKILLSAIAIITVSLFSTNICIANSEISATNSVVEISGRSVTVVKISGTITNPGMKGDYDSDSNMITIRGDQYSVKENPYYGGNDKRRGKYRYYAGEVYFFNL